MTQLGAVQGNRMPDQTIPELATALRKHGATVSVGSQQNCEHLRALRAAGALAETNGNGALRLAGGNHLTVLIGDDVVFSKKPVISREMS